MIKSYSQWSGTKKLTNLIDFINQFNFVDDIVHCQQEDYWAIPLQRLVTRGRDCEDLALAKHFTLSAMGMKEDKLRLTCIKALTICKAHMVGSYFKQSNAEPLVMDNSHTTIMPASQHKDLSPV